MLPVAVHLVVVQEGKKVRISDPLLGEGKSQERDETGKGTRTPSGQ